MNNRKKTLTSVFLLLLAATWLCVSACGDEVDEGAAPNDTQTVDGNPDSSGDTGTHTGNDTETGTTCGETTVDFVSEHPTVLLMIDRSSSMFESFGISNRWETARQAMINPENGFIPQLESEIFFGISMYAGVDESGNPTCPYIETVPPALNNYQNIATVYNASEPLHDTPTPQSFELVTDILLAVESQGNKVIVLVTDGLPDTCGDLDDVSKTAQPATIAAVKAAYQSGISTYVVSVGEQDASGHFQDIADAGINTPGAPYYEAMDPEALTAAFQQIIGGVRRCIFTLQGEVVDGAQTKCAVTYGDKSFAFGDANGWKLNTPGQLELVGEACEAIKTGSGTLNVNCPCDAFNPFLE